MMKTEKLNWKIILDLLNNEEQIENIELEFDSEKIYWKDAMLLGKSGFEVPDEYIDYDDDNIDYSDIPAITQEDLDSGKIKWIYKAEVPMLREIENWVKTEHIDVNKLLGELIEKYYKTLKKSNKNFVS